jgi:hypothetical protein
MIRNELEDARNLHAPHRSLSALTIAFSKSAAPSPIWKAQMQSTRITSPKQSAIALRIELIGRDSIHRLHRMVYRICVICG